MSKSRPRAKSRDNIRRGKKKVSVLTHKRVEYIDYKDVDLLRRFMSDRGKIRARRVTGNDAQQQRTVARAIKNAREMALLPYANRITTQRGAGRSGGPARRGRPRLARRLTPEPAECATRPRRVPAAGDAEAPGEAEVAGVAEVAEVAAIAEEAGAPEDAEETVVVRVVLRDEVPVPRPAGRHL